jgi:hypothetical protein
LPPFHPPPADSPHGSAIAGCELVYDTRAYRNGIARCRAAGLIFDKGNERPFLDSWHILDFPLFVFGSSASPSPRPERAQLLIEVLVVGKKLYTSSYYHQTNAIRKLKHTPPLTKRTINRTGCFSVPPRPPVHTHTPTHTPLLLLSTQHTHAPRPSSLPNGAARDALSLSSARQQARDALSHPHVNNQRNTPLLPSTRLYDYLYFAMNAE